MIIELLNLNGTEAHKSGSLLGWENLKVQCFVLFSFLMAL